MSEAVRHIFKPLCAYRVFFGPVGQVSLQILSHHRYRCAFLIELIRGTLLIKGKWEKKESRKKVGGEGSTMVRILAARPSCPRFDSQYFPKKLVDKIVDVVEVNQWSYLKQTLPWLENVNLIHLELSSVTKKVEVKCPFGFTNSRPLDHKIARPLLCHWTTNAAQKAFLQ